MTAPHYAIGRDADGLPVWLYWLSHGPTLKEQEMSWREQAAPIIAKVIAETKGEDLHLLKDRLRAAFPWGTYDVNYHPARVWRDEIKRQLGTKPPLQRGGRRGAQTQKGQGDLWT